MLQFDPSRFGNVAVRTPASPLVFSGSTTIPEWAASGTQVGVFSIASGSGTYTFSFAGGGNPGGKFTLTGGVLTTNTALDATTIYPLVVQATNGVDPTLTFNLTVNVSIAPTVSSIALTSSATHGVSGANDTYITGDSVRFTVTFSKVVNVLPGNTGTQTPDDVPQLTLSIGGSNNKAASYVSGTGTAALVFGYTVQANDSETAGTSISANQLTLNSALLLDVDGNSAVLTHSSVAAQSSAKVVGETSLTLSSLSPANNATGVALNANFVATFGWTHLVFGSSVVIGLYKTSDDSHVQDFTAADIGGALSISGAVLTINPTSDLLAGSYYILIGSTSIQDNAGQFYAGISSKTTWTVTAAASDTWNPSDKNAGISLSNGNLTATTSSGSTQVVRSITSHSTGKYHVEFTVNTAGSFYEMGFYSAAGSLSSYIANTSKVGLIQRPTTFYDFNGPINELNANFAVRAGDVVAWEIDFDNHIARVQNFTHGSGWLANIDISTLTGTPWCIAAELDGSTQITLNTGGSAWAVTPTSGFGNW